MHEPPLLNRRILVVEDEYLLASELERELEEIGATVLGPVGTLDGALRLIPQEPEIDGAVLDVNLGGEAVYPVADLLARRAVPFVFTTGYDASVLPVRFAHVAKCEKPLDIALVARAIRRAISH